MSVHLATSSLLEPPSGASPKVAPEPSGETLAKLKVLETHFGGENFDLPMRTASVERRRLDEREMMYLVISVITCIARWAIADGYLMV